MGQVGILNVGAGDTKLVFDKDNPAECIRAARIVKDMLRRGYALLIEDPPGSKTYKRAHDFDETRCEYIIADLDPEIAAAADAKEKSNEEAISEAASQGTAPSRSKGSGGRKGKLKMRPVPASGTRAVAVARSAGG